MSGYLQRLLDRAPPAPAAALPSMPLAMPAGPSLSPVALADQRLNDPSLLDQIGVPQLQQPEFAESLGSDSPHSSLTRTRKTPPESGAARPSSAPESNALRPAPTRIEPASPAVPAPIEPVPIEPRFRQRSPSEIQSEDLLPPEASESVPEPASRSAQQPPASAVEPAAPTSPSIAKARPAEAVVEDAVVEAAPAPREPAPTPPQPEPPTASPAPVRSTQHAAQSLPVIAEATRSVEVEPPPPRQPAPLVPEPMASIDSPATTPAARRESEGKADKVSDASPGETQKSARSTPRSAADASIIGALARRPRALTLFGLRRR